MYIVSTVATHQPYHQWLTVCGAHVCAGSTLKYIKIFSLLQIKMLVALWGMEAGNFEPAIIVHDGQQLFKSCYVLMP